MVSLRTDKNMIGLVFDFPYGKENFFREDDEVAADLVSGILKLESIFHHGQESVSQDIDKMNISSGF